MIKRFEVCNFKGFKKNMIIDFTAREYEYNKHLVQKGIVNKAIVYGKNGIGKSSFGIALFDIIGHLTDKERMNFIYLQNYRNLDSDSEEVRFKYVFQFDLCEVEYEYYKANYDYLLREKLSFDGKVVVNFDYFNRDENYIDKQYWGDLNVDLIDNKLSVLKYIYRNTPTDTEAPLTQMIQFCENMLWYRCLSEGNSYSGFTNGGSFLVEKLYESGKLEDFKKFLKENDLSYNLKFESINGRHQLMAMFHKGKNSVPFETVASTGTKALFLFYIWSISSFKQISFLFIDEFDAFFHYEAAESIINRLNKSISFQSVVTSHNTYLMQNKLTRPDCCYIMTEDRISSLFNCTDKEIREAHNLEKMYINGVFNV